MPQVRTRFISWLAVLSLCGFVGLSLWPITYKLTRLSQVFLFTVGLFSLLIVFRQRGYVRWIAGLCLFFCIAFALSPGRAYNPSPLRNRYIAELRRLEGTRYVWGGEKTLGIDCSGLARRGLFNALWKESILTLNPSQLRSAMELWWNDQSAKALGDNEDGRTSLITNAKAIHELDACSILAGDMAITPGGIHVLIYLGGTQWIEADPALERVIILDAKTSSNSWLQVPVTIVRWTLLSSGT